MLHKKDTPPVGKGRFPLTAIVGQQRLKLALLVNVIDPQVGGVLVRGNRGTGKSTAARRRMRVRVRSARRRSDVR